MMKLKISSIVLVTFVSLNINLPDLNPKSVNAQGCYMQGANGEVLDLSGLCGNNPNSNNIPNNTTTPNETTPNQLTGSSNLFQVPIKRREGGTPVIDVTFNGKKTYEMLLDTGATGTVLTTKMAQQLRLKPEGVVMVSTASHNAVPFVVTTVDSIQVGQGIIKKVQVAVGTSLPMGLLGQDFFENYDITIKENVIEFKLR